MPEIQVTDDQLERLDALREELADAVVGKYGHVRRQDALEYLLDQHAEHDGEGTDGPAAGPSPSSPASSSESSAGPPGGEEEERRDVEGTNGVDADAAVDADDSAGSGESESEPEAAGDDADGEDGDGGAMLDAMMNLLSAHEDKWREASGGDARYEVDLPDGSTEQARTKDDVRALLFEHYR